MKRAVFLCLLAVSCRGPAAHPSIAITGVTIIDVRDGSLMPDMTVLITGERISAISPSTSTRLPARIRPIDGRMKYLMPGLWDMQVRSDGDVLALNSMLAAGITGVRDVDSDAAPLAETRRLIDTRAIAGPRVFVVSAAAASARRGWVTPAIHRFYFTAPDQWASIRAGFRETAAQLRRDGVPILAASNWSASLEQLGAPAGLTLQAELAALVDAGFTPAEALRAATINAVEFLGLTGSLGTVETGKLADLLLLDVNPLADIRGTRRVSAVLLDGRIVAQP